MVEPQGLAYAGNDRVVAWGTAGQAPVAWEPLSGKVLSPLPEHTAAVRSIGFAAGGKEIVTAGNDGKIVRWDATTGKPLGVVTLRPSRGPNANIRSLINVSPDGTRAISSFSPPAVFDLATGVEEFSLPRGPIGAGTTTFTTSVTSDVTKAVTFSTTYDVKKPQMCAVWDLTARRKIAEVELTGLSGQLPRLPHGAVSPSGNRLVTVGYRATAAAGRSAGRNGLGPEDGQETRRGRGCDCARRCVRDRGERGVRDRLDREWAHPGVRLRNGQGRG